MSCISIFFVYSSIIWTSDSDTDMSFSMVPKLILLLKRYKTSSISFKKFLASKPSFISSFKYFKDSFSLPFKTSLNREITLLLSASPNISLTSVSSTILFSTIDCEIKARSSSDIESLTEPSDVLAINFIASFDILPFSFSAIFFK